VAVLDGGRIAGFESPDDLYDRPGSLAVAAAGGPFVAVDGCRNSASVADTELGPIAVESPRAPTDSMASPAAPDGQVGTVIIRPEQLELEREAGPEGGVWVSCST
jgi:ABC-type Fe3+/spermidine/putrescine transport system ATPase subunit